MRPGESHIDQAVTLLPGSILRLFARVLDFQIVHRHDEAAGPLDIAAKILRQCPGIFGPVVAQRGLVEGSLVQPRHIDDVGLQTFGLVHGKHSHTIRQHRGVEIRTLVILPSHPNGLDESDCAGAGRRRVEGMRQRHQSRERRDPGVGSGA